MSKVNKVSMTIAIAVLVGWLFFFKAGQAYVPYMGHFVSNYWIKVVVLSPLLMVVFSLALRACGDTARTVVLLGVAAILSVVFPLVLLLVKDPWFIPMFSDYIGHGNGPAVMVVLLPIMAVVLWIIYFSIGCLLSNLRDK